MDRIFHLSFLLDQDGYKRIDLVSFYELSKLDDFIMERFTSTRDVRKKYEMDISEFCLDNMIDIQKENKRNKRNWTGSIAIVGDERDKLDKTCLLYKIPIIYQNDKQLLAKNDCLVRIKEKLHDKEVIRRIFEEKKYLLSNYERDLLFKHYSRRDNKYLNSFIGNFYNRLKRMKNDEILYFYCRSLMNICKLNELVIKTKFGEIQNINEELPVNTSLIKKGAYQEGYLNDLMEKEDYEELYNVYTIDEINNNSDSLEKGKTK